MMQRLIPVLFILLLAGCINPPSYSTVPEIKFLSLSASQVVSGVDTLLVSFEYKDGDGDIGVKEGDTTINAWLVDNRTGFPYTYQLPFVNKKGNSNSISGTIFITVSPFTLNCRPDHKTTDTLSYQIYIQDRAGNFSNKVNSSEVIIICQ
jgi:uncharacterized membrane protein